MRCIAAFEIAIVGHQGATLEAALDEAFARHPQRDLVVLDPGTRVADGWLDRLAACAGREPRVATVSPFCNVAQHCGYPRPGVANGLPAGTTLAQLDAIFAAANAGESLDIPCAEPACVYYPGEARQAAGMAAGFGERAAALGYRHLLCADLFVSHEGGFPPGLPGAATEEYQDREPLRPLRRRVDLARLRGSSLPCVLMVTHHWGGGVQRHVDDLARLLAGGSEVLRLRPDRHGVIEIRWMREGEELQAWIPAPRWQGVVDFLGAAGVDRVHFHHVHALPREALELPRALGVPYDLTLHDYYPICPRYHLAPTPGESCDRDAGECTRCLEREPAQWGLALTAWRELFHEFLRGAARVIAPSRDLAQRIERYFPGTPLLVWPHAERSLPARAVHKVALLGAISPIKGARLLEACVEDARARGLPLHFHVAGYVDRPMAVFPEAPLTLGGSYPEGELAQLLALERPDAFFFPSRVAETYSYTLTEAMHTGLPIVATDMGAFPERLAHYPRHALLPRAAGAREANDALLACLGDSPRLASANAPWPVVDPEAYGERLAQPYRRRPRAPGAPPDPAPAIWYPAVRARDVVSFRDLYDAGIRSGHGESRAFLASRIGEVDAELVHAREQRDGARDELTGTRAELDDARRNHDRHERELQQALEAARARIGELESSAFWRATYPFRRGVHSVKLALRRLAALPREARLAGPRLATARQIAKDQGLVELVRRLRSKATPRPRPAGLRARGGLESVIRPLHVPSSQAPRVSVIVPTYGHDLHTYACLVGLAPEAEDVALEVLVMDDCAPSPAARALRNVTGVRFERNEANLGFLRNCNRAASLARGEYLLFINNDAVVSPGTLAALLDVFVRFPEAGGAGAKLVYPDGRLQEAGAIVWRDGSAWNWGRGDDPDKPEYNYLRAVDYCSAACLMVPRALFEQVGRFDERYVPAYCEDTDLCFKLRAAGRPVYYQPAAEVVHFEGVSHGTDTGEGVKRYQVENQARLRERWKDVLGGHRANGVLPRLEADRGARRRVLLVEACMLTPDQDSGSLRTWRLMRVMRELGCKVTFIADNLERREPYASRLAQEGVEVLHAPFARSVDEVIRDRGGEFDVIILARYYIASRHIDTVRRCAPDALLVFDTLDLHFLRNRRLAQLERSAALAQGAEAIYREEVECVRRCDVTWVVSDVERDMVLREVPRATVLVQTNIHTPAAAGRPHAEREGLLFVGGFRHPPNVDAALYLARDIVPRLRQLLPGVTTYAIGSNPSRSVMQLQAEGFAFLGYVPDLEPWLERCRVSVSPLRYGAGVKGKVNQAMSHGLPVVATRISVEGMHLVEGEEVLVADDPQAFAEAVARLYRDEALWERLSRAGRENVERHFSPRVAALALRELFALADARSRPGLEIAI